ncbi:hypothetical protein JKP88DRAFT_252899 [Tribonema minus]|uniref:Uncharacterized protein n=1 Tax=Tribonema minus TaxID=303371 RepID=A0A835ZDK8_9STRA|nr:hypothetical protein JKP88DRAFT_252899 [Tribonema minus]
MERFASNRPAGIEKFRTIINGYLNELLSYIRGTGGDDRVLHGRYDAEGIARRGLTGDVLMDAEGSARWRVSTLTLALTLLVYNAEIVALAEMLGAAPMTDRSGEMVLAALATCQCGGIPLNKLSPYAFEGSDGVPLTLHGCIDAGNIAAVEGSDGVPLTLHGYIGAGDIAAVEVGGIVFINKTEWETFVLKAHSTHMTIFTSNFICDAPPLRAPAWHQVGGIVFNNKKEWETFVCGPVIAQLAVAQELSGKSEFCLSAQVRRTSIVNFNSEL